MKGREGHRKGVLALCRTLGPAIGLLAWLAVPPFVSAQTSDTGAKHDTSLPIVITADSLEVKQKEQRAVFHGNVEAIQDEMVLRADVLTVHYRERDEGGASTEDGDEPAIRRIDAVGNVFITSPEETAQADAGVYDVDRGTIVLTGDVILTRGEHVIRGDRAEIDLESGESRVLSAADGPTKSGRVRGVFVPGKKK
ncbi:MAG: LptA/OstA family protein [Alphaproteobacteria bacterium]